MTNGVCFYEKMTNVPWESQKVRIRAILRQWDGIAVVDATGVGDSFVEALFNEGLPIIPFKISSNLVKKNLIDKLKTYIENSYISIPNIPDLISELKTFEIKASSRSDVFLFSAPEGMHDDSVMALALAVSKLDSSAVIYQQSSVSAEDRQSLNIDPHTGYVV
jgi:phage FluMu gp28-like protein